MSDTMHPPANRRCQIYEGGERCILDGNHWVSWGGCPTHIRDGQSASHVCSAEFYSWECDGTHLFGEAA